MGNNSYLNVSNQGSSFIYQKNKINNKNRKNIVNEIKDKDYNDINISEDGKIEDINYEYLRLGTDDITYNTNNNVINNAYLNLSNSYLNFNSGNNTFYHSTDKQYDYKMDNLYNNKDNIFLNQSSPFYQKKLKKQNNGNIFNNMGYKRIYLLNTNNCFMINIENILIFEEKFNNIVSYFMKFSGISISLI